MIAHPAFPDVALADVVAELQREAEARRKLYPELARKGRMTPAEAEDGHALIQAMLADCQRLAQVPWRSREESHAFTWAQRRAALQRELALRARLYPGWIAEGRLDQAEGTRRTRRLTTLLWIYEDGFDWRPAGGAAPGFLSRHDDPEARDARVEWHRHYFDVSLARGDRAMAQGLLRCLALDGAATLAAELEAQLNPPQQEQLAL